jgi:hypothetical protein
MTPIIGTHADIRPHHYRFIRQRGDVAYVPFIQARRYSGWWREAAQGMALVVFLFAMFLLAGGAAYLFGAHT